MMHRSEKGFSLIELLIGMSIMGILTGLAVTTFWVYKDDASYSIAEATLRSARTAMELGDQDAPAGFALPLTYTADTGGPVIGVMSTVLPGATTPDNLKLGAMYNQCNAASPPLQINQYLVAKPCSTDRYVQWIRFCGGLEIIQGDIAGPC